MDSFKIGVLKVQSAWRAIQMSEKLIFREVTVSVDSAVSSGAVHQRTSCLSDASALQQRQSTIGDRTSLHQGATRTGDGTNALPLSAASALSQCVACVDGLEADKSYQFVLAASNCLGRGQWSAPSTVVRTDKAPPDMPSNAVATVSTDAQQRVMVTVTWECRPSGSMPTSFHVTVTPTVCDGRAPLHERVAISGAIFGQRMTWAGSLMSPGRYEVEVVTENAAGQLSSPAVLALDVLPEAFPVTAGLQTVPQWASEHALVLGAAPETMVRFAPDLKAGKWMHVLLLWYDTDPTVLNSKNSVVPVDVMCAFRHRNVQRGLTSSVALASGVTASRLQVALPANVPLSLRLVCTSPSVVQSRSEPVAFEITDDGHIQRAEWEVWSRQQNPARWISLPTLMQSHVEAAWLEGQARVTFELPRSEPEGCGTGTLLPGKYELSFGDECRVQHSVQRLGPVSWQANARRVHRRKEEEGTMSEDNPLTEASCVICMAAPRTHAFMHADTGDGHLAVCATCADMYRAEAAAGGASRAVSNCPMCRRGFSVIQRIYQ